MKLFVAIALLVVVAVSAQEFIPSKELVDPNATPGLRVTTTKKGLDAFLKILDGLINKQFEKIHLPDMKITESVPIVGSVEVDVKDIWIHDFKIPHMSAKTYSPDEVQFEIGPDIHFNFKANFHWRQHSWPHISGGGSVEAHPKGGDIKVKMHVKPDQGHFHLKVEKATCNFHSFDIKVHGTASWLINFFLKLFAGKIKNTIDEAIGKQLHHLIDKNVNEILKKIPEKFDIGHGPSAMEIGIPLLQIKAQHDYIDAGLAFSVRNLKTGQMCPLPTPDIPDHDVGSTARMLQVFMGQHFFNCALWVSYHNGVFDKVLHSNTRDLALLIPAMYEKWPNSPVEIRIIMHKLGAINMTTSGLKIDLPLAANMTVHHNGTAHHACELGMEPDLGLKIWIGKGHQDHPYLFFNVTHLHLKWSVINTRVGPIDLHLLQGLTNILAPIIVKFIDQMIEKGIPIPVHQGLGLTNDEIVWRHQYMIIEGDFIFIKGLPPVDTTPELEWIDAPVPEDTIVRDVHFD